MIAFKELLVRAKRGEEKAFEELFEQFEPLVILYEEQKRDD